MIEVKAPESFSEYKGKPSIFLAGSIEMGKADDWQEKVVTELYDVDVLVLNPRRSDWNPDWDQSIENKMFREQVEWELNALDAADIILMYFLPDTKAPITLLELGIYAAKSPEKLIVCCPPGYWRKGNVDIVCARYGIRQVELVEDLIAAVTE